VGFVHEIVILGVVPDIQVSVARIGAIDALVTAVLMMIGRLTGSAGEKTWDANDGLASLAVSMKRLNCTVSTRGSDLMRISAAFASDSESESAKSIDACDSCS
jgi:hypothetical protein